MSLSGSLFNAVSGLQTSQRQINVTSANVSNANVEGYSRKTASAVTALTAGQNSGVDLAQVRREVDAYLDSEVLRSSTTLGGLDVKAEFMDRLTGLFGTLDSDSTLANGLNDLSKAIEQLALEPNSASARNDVVEAADEMARQLNRFADETVNLRVEADNQINQGILEVNDALERINELNAEISKAYALDRPAADLEDERDREMAVLSEWLDVSAFPRENGEIVVMGKTAAGSATTLVDSRAVQFDFDKANELGPTADSGDLPHIAQDGAAQLTSASGGRLGALIEVRDSSLPGFHRDLDRLTQEIRDRVNAAHNEGTAGNAGVETIEGTVDVGSTPPTDTLSVGGSGDIVIHRVDATGSVIASTPAIDITAATTAADVAAALDADANINASIVDGRLQISSATAGERVALDDGDTTVAGLQTAGGDPRSFSHYFGLNDLFVTPGVGDAPGTAGEIENAAGAIAVRQDILDDPDLLSRGSTATTAPLAVGDQAVPVGDNTVAQALGAVFEDKAAIQRGGMMPGMRSATLADYASDMLSYYATASERAEASRDFQKTVHDELKFRADSESGVNIDEELSNMITFENAYNASARVISTVQQMFDTLDRMMN